MTTNDSTNAEKKVHPTLAQLAGNPDILKVLTQGLLEPVETPRFNVFFNGVDMTGAARHILIECFHMGGGRKNAIGVIEYGQPPNPDGGKNPPDTCRVTGPGGVISALFAVVGGQLYLGLIEERRVLEFHPEMHPKATVQGMPRGYLFQPGGSATVAAVGEVNEEVGKLPNLKPVLSIGEPFNVDNAWWDFTLKTGGGQGGVDVVLFEIDPKLLVPNKEGGTFRLNEQYPRDPGSPWEKIGRCDFEPWNKLVQKRDGMNALGFARVMGSLFETGRLTMTVSSMPK